MNRADLQSLAELRIREAKLLLDAGAYAGSYYLAGYSVECALKSCIAKETKQYDFPDKTFVNKSWTHELEKLLQLARLEDKLAAEMRNNKRLEQFWACVVDWVEEKRYELGVTEKEARDLWEAIADPRDGVLEWLKKFW